MTIPIQSFIVQFIEFHVSDKAIKCNAKKSNSPNNSILVHSKKIICPFFVINKKIIILKRIKQVMFLFSFLQLD